MKRILVLLVALTAAVLLACLWPRPPAHPRRVVQASITPSVLQRREPFVRYIPSTWEKDWTQWVHEHHTFDDDPCTRLRSQQQNVAEYLRRLHEVYTDNIDDPDPILSKLVYESPHPGSLPYAKYIEPLVGLLRHPLLCTNWSIYRESKDFLMLDSGTRLDALYMDLGASSWNEGAGGPSQSWFWEQYQARGIQFGSMMLWEASYQDPTALMRHVPAEVWPIYQYFNVPVTKGPDGQWTAFRALKQKRCIDYVILKIDIDNPSLERQLVNDFMADPSLVAMVDEFFFEHHTYTQPMHTAWGTRPGADSLWESYQIFLALRRQGVRAHSWV